VKLAAALDLQPGEVVALVGGGGKTSVMFLLAREMVEAGTLVLSTTTTHIFASQIRQAPAHLLDTDAQPERLRAMLAAHRHVLVTGPTNPATARAAGLSLERLRELRTWCPEACVLDEADGSRTRPFKAPADHEPVIPRETTLVVAVVGADALGQPLAPEHVHRPERVSALSGAAPDSPVTPELVARVLTHPEGGRKGVPPGARLVVLINKMDAVADPTPARELAELLLREPTVHAVALAAVRRPDPVLEVCRRR